jgi:hypothetical protein
MSVGQHAGLSVGRASEGSVFARLLALHVWHRVQWAEEFLRLQGIGHWYDQDGFRAAHLANRHLMQIGQLLVWGNSRIVAVDFHGSCIIAMLGTRASVKMDADTQNLSSEGKFA